MKKLIICSLFACLLISCGGGGGGDAQGDPSSGDDIWSPAVRTSWTIQLNGALNTSYDVDVYDIDLFDTSSADIAALKSAGRKVICYFSAGSYENWRDDKDDFPAAVIGDALVGWAGENWLDIRSEDVKTIMAARMDLAVSKGCDAVDPDNVDGYSNVSGFPLTAADQLAYNTWLAQTAHAKGLAVGLKNDLDQITDLVNYFDFAVNESCYDYSECGDLTPFTDDNKPVFGIEYAATTDVFCDKVNTLDFNFLYMNTDLDGTLRQACR